MRRVYLAILVGAVAAVSLAFAPMSEAEPTGEATVEISANTLDGVQDVPMTPIPSVLEFSRERCSTNSDCPHSQCRDRQCGGCSTNSDCGFGQCRDRLCGGCSTNSDCNGWGTCRDRRCGGCSTNSDCGAFGRCRDRRCTESPY